MTSDTLFARAAARDLRPAVFDAGGGWRYGELLEASRRIAGGLLDGRSDLDQARVAFLVPPGRAYVAVQWAAWRAGGVAVPLATSHPDPELAYVLDDARPSIVVGDTGFAERLAPLARTRGIRFTTVQELVDGPAASSLPPLGPDRRALMLYTSGTTGRPKGVVTTHGGLRAQITTLVQAWGWREEDRILHVLPLHHVHGIVNALGCALWAGAAVEFLSPFDAEAAWERLAGGGITVFMAVPTIYHRLIGASDAADSTTRARWSAGARALRLMVSGSAALPVSLLTRWRELTGHTLLERYGMTEIGMALANPLQGERRAGTVGRPLPGVEVRLVDEAGRSAAEGAPGEIEVRGPQVFREYWDRPDDSAGAFHDGWFRTGDVAVLENGYYRILGRRSTDIIKTAGYKVSALEIEEVLREHPGVSDAAVVGLPDLDLGERLVAAVVPAGPVAPDPEALRVWVRERLAPYKVPRQIRLFEELPRNAMGKVTKPAIRERLA